MHIQHACVCVNQNNCMFLSAIIMHYLRIMLPCTRNEAPLLGLLLCVLARVCTDVRERRGEQKTSSRHEDR